jgi:TetR/AcrR family transcriptional regulator, transcriptional repressor for nem operon
METTVPLRRRPGRPPKQALSRLVTREALIRGGLELLTERGFNSVGLEEVLRRVGVPKGSFYHYFSSKDDFGQQVLAAYAAYFAGKLDRWLLDESRPPLQRIAAFVADARAGMARHHYCRGCLVGNLGQEMGALDESFREQLEAVFQDWQTRLAACLAAAVAAGELAADTDYARWAAFFWIGWEGAVLRAKLVRNDAPLRLFADTFFAGLPTLTQP